MTDAKQAFRKERKAVRAALTTKERQTADAAIARTVIALPLFHKAPRIYTYVSVGQEIDTRAIIQHAWETGKTVAVPRVMPGTRSMKWFKLESFDQLEVNEFGIEEPVPDLCEPVSGEGSSSDLALVPALTFDKEGYRMGYGGGFYDTFLATFKGASLGLARKAERVPSLVELSVIEPHDKAVELVVEG